MSKTITVADIAEQLNMSRNTVSKALNGKYVPEKTRTIILNKARELNYKQMNIDSLVVAEAKKYRFLLLSGKPLNNINFFIPIIQSIENYCYDKQYEFFQYVFNKNISSFKTLATHIHDLNLDGIIAIETFEKDLIDRLLSIDIPICFIDFSASSINVKGNYDIIESNNSEPINFITDEIINKFNFTRFSFVGDFLHCMSFKDRYLGMLSALAINGIHHTSEMDILRSDNFDYGNPEVLKIEMLKLKQKPQCYICSNDFIARSVINALKRLEIKVPQDCLVVGYDDAADSTNSIPYITTVGMNKQYMGIEAMKALLERIENPNLPTKTIKIDSDIIYRHTTDKR